MLREGQEVDLRMVEPFVFDYSTEGAPLFIGDLPRAAAWRGTEDDGSGVIVEYMGLGIERLPKPLAAKRPGRQSRAFPTMAQARAFEAQVLEGFRRLNPTAARLARYPGQPAYYAGGKRVFSVELKRSSAFDKALAALKKGVQLVSLDGKRALRALFMQQEGGGLGVVVADPSRGLLGVAKLSGPSAGPGLARALLARRRPTAQGSFALDGRVLVFDSALSAAQLARKNWNQESLLEAGATAFEQKPAGPLWVPDQQAPCAAFVRMGAGRYAFSYQHEVEVLDVAANILWLEAKRA